MVLTESLSRKLFGDIDPVGKLITLDGQIGGEKGEQTFTVSGVMKDVPKNSHLQFEILGSYGALEKTTNDYFYSFNNIWNNYVYLLLEEKQKPEVIEGYLHDLEQEHYPDLLIYNLVNILDILPGEGLFNQIGPSVEFRDVHILIALTLIIILSACFNYTNLSIARSLRRAKEIGVRKVVGADRMQVFTQFSIEAMLMAVGALVISGGVFVILRPYFMELVLKSDVATLSFRWKYVVYFVLFSVGIGFVAGLFPAILFSRIRAKAVLKDAFRLRLMTGVSLRKVLIVFQFALSIGFITAAVIEYRQYQYALHFDLGYQTADILNIELQENDPDLLQHEIEKLPEVMKVSRSGIVTSTGTIWGRELKCFSEGDSSMKNFEHVDVNYIDTSYFSLHHFNLLAGSNFPHEIKKGEEAKYVIINQMLSENLGFPNPGEAIGKEVQEYSGKRLKIVGVVENFHQRTLTDDVRPFSFFQNPEEIHLLNLKVHTNDPLALIQKLEEIWKKFDENHPFKAEFFDERIQKNYREYLNQSQIIGYLAFLAVIIATLGLLGIAVYTAETRMKEISVRKVLGATERQLVQLLSRGFFWMMLLAALIAVPVTYWVIDHYVFSDLIYRVQLGLVELLSGVVIIFLIGGLTIVWQTALAARANPADLLRDE